jgi:uncharacterized protein HemX
MNTISKGIAMSFRRNQKGIGSLEAILVLVAVCALVGIGWLVWRQNEVKLAEEKVPSQVKNHSESDFEACKNAAGSKMLETYPQQCMTKDGKIYTTSAVTPSTDLQKPTILK